MKKYLVFLAITLLAVVFSRCSSTKKAAAPTVDNPNALTYQADVKSIIANNCAPCHFPDKGGNKPPLHTYELVAASADNIVSRIEMHPGDRGFMPFKRQRLSDSVINVVKTWVRDGKLEK